MRRTQSYAAIPYATVSDAAYLATRERTELTQADAALERAVNVELVAEIRSAPRSWCQARATDIQGARDRLRSEIDGDSV